MEKDIAKIFEEKVRLRTEQLRSMFKQQLENSLDPNEVLRDEITKIRTILYTENPVPERQTLAQRMGKDYFFERKYFREYVLKGNRILSSESSEKMSIYIEVHASYDHLCELENQLNFGETFLTNLDELAGFHFYLNAQGENTNPIKQAQKIVERHGWTSGSKFQDKYRAFLKNRFGESATKKNIIAERQNIINELNRLGKKTDLAQSDFNKLLIEMEGK